MLTKGRKPEINFRRSRWFHSIRHSKDKKNLSEGHRSVRISLKRTKVTKHFSAQIRICATRWPSATPQSQKIMNAGKTIRFDPINIDFFKKRNAPYICPLLTRSRRFRRMRSTLYRYNRGPCNIHPIADGSLGAEIKSTNNTVGDAI